MATLIFQTAEEKRGLQGILDGLCAGAESDASLIARTAAARAEAESARGLTHAERMTRALQAVDAAWAFRKGA